jgi:hypothetical protein
MTRMQAWRWVLAALLLAMGGTTARAGEFAIQSFDGTGRLTFNEVSTAETYRVEWAPSRVGRGQTHGRHWLPSWRRVRGL